jgi:hypothetical protein
MPVIRAYLRVHRAISACVHMWTLPWQGCGGRQSVPLTGCCLCGVSTITTVLHTDGMALWRRDPRSSSNVGDYQVLVT